MNLTNSRGASLAGFEKRERLLAAKLLSENKCISEYSFTSGRIFYDGIAVSTDGRKALFEIKVRDFDVNTYNTYFLEVAKFKNLFEAGERTGHTILYINFFKTDDPERWEYISFNLSKRIEHWRKNGSPATERIRMNKETFISRQEKIYKDVIRLSYEPEMDKKGWVFTPNNKKK